MNTFLFRYVAYLRPLNEELAADKPSTTER